MSGPLVTLEARLCPSNVLILQLSNPTMNAMAHENLVEKNSMQE